MSPAGYLGGRYPRWCIGEALNRRSRRTIVAVLWSDVAHDPRGLRTRPRRRRSAHNG